MNNGFKEFRKQLVVLPTGGGKTIVFSALAQQALPGRTLILCHREELVDQAIEKLYRSTGIIAQKEKAEHKASLRADVVVASVQTMARRLGKWPANHFAKLTADEGHHLLSDQWQAVLRHFDSYAHVLAVTATPDRGDKRNLGTYIENIAFEITLLDLINQKYLAPICVRSIPLQIDLGNVASTRGDYDAAQLGDALAPYLGAVAGSLAKEAAFRRTLVFLPLRATSMAFRDACRAAGLSAEHVDGDSPDRKEILQRFARGEFEVLCNAMLLTEGFDDPGIDCVVILRPTRSRGLYSQMVGRGTRIAPGKDNLLLLDYLWLHQKHNLIRPAHLIASNEQEAEEMTAVATAGGGQEELDLRDMVTTAREKREKKLREELEAKAKRKATEMDAMEFALSLGGWAAVEWEDEVAWHAKPPTEKQLAYLARHKINPETVKSRGHASALQDLIWTRQKMKLATPKQAAYIKRLGHPSPEKATFQEASEFISRMKNQPREVAA